MTRMLRYLVVATAVVIIAGCRLEVVSVKGGDVQSASGNRNCPEGNNCSFEITALPFSESFTANPKPGYEFVRWNKGRRFECGGSTDPTCSVSLADDPVGEIALAFFGSNYLMPVYNDVGIDTDGDGVRDEVDEDDDNDGILDVDDACPFNPEPGCGADIVLANGKEWFQPDLFTGSSWDEIEVLCPTSSCDGMLNEYNLSGWTWANNTDVEALFQFYELNDCVGVDAFFFDGWRTTPIRFFDDLSLDYSVIFGKTSTEPEGYATVTRIETQSIECSSGAGTNFSNVAGHQISSGELGAWFYRNP